MRDLIFVLTGTIAVIIFSLAVIVGIGALIAAHNCAGMEEATGIKTTYAGLECYAELEGRMVPHEYVFGDALELRVKQKD